MVEEIVFSENESTAEEPPVLEGENAYEEAFTEEIPAEEVSAEEVSGAEVPTEEVPPVDYAAQAASDLKEIQALSPEFLGAKHLSELPFARRFAELRDLGLSVKEALFATLPTLPIQSGKEHLRSSVPRSKSAPDGVLPPDEMRAAKDLFYGLSEKEINSLYKRVSTR